MNYIPINNRNNQGYQQTKYSVEQEKDNKTSQHGAKPHESYLAIFKLHELEKGFTPRTRKQKRKDTFQYQHQCNRFQESIPHIQL